MVVSVKVTVPSGPALPVPLPVREVRPPNVAVSVSGKPDVMSVPPRSASRSGQLVRPLMETGVAVPAPKVASPEYEAPI